MRWVHGLTLSKARLAVFPIALQPLQTIITLRPAAPWEKPRSQGALEKVEILRSKTLMVAGDHLLSNSAPQKNSLNCNPLSPK